MPGSAKVGRAFLLALARLRQARYTLHKALVVPMCFNTGELKAIPKETIELAQQLQPVLDMIRKDGCGEGQITIKISGGKIRKFFEFAGRWFFKEPGTPIN